MNKLLITLILLLPSFVFSQTNDGFYRADFTKSGEVSRTEADFEIKGEIVAGRLKIGEQIQKIRGTIDNKNLSATTERENGATYQIVVNFNKSETNAELWKKIEQYTAKGRETSQTMTKGMFRKIDFPAGFVSEIPDISKLTIEYPKQTFPKEFTGTVNVIIVKEGESTVYKVVISARSANWDTRTLRFAVKHSAKDNQKIWQGTEIENLDYAEKIAMTHNAFVTDKAYVATKDGSATEIRILEETDNEVIFKLTNVSVKNSINNDIASINGTIRAIKSKSK